jgi:hypothetical protein
MQHDVEDRRAHEIARLTFAAGQVDGSSRALSYTFNVTNAGPHFAANLLLRLRAPDGTPVGETMHVEAILPGVPATQIIVDTPPGDQYRGPYKVEASWDDGRGRIVNFKTRLEVGLP